MTTTGRFGPFRALAAAVVAAGLATAMPAQAQDNQFTDDPAGSGGGASSSGDLITGATLDLIIASFERNGFSVELTEDDEGAPLIKSTDAGEPFSVYFYSCPGDSPDWCFIQLNTGWNMENGITLAKIEDWNANKVWGQAFRDDEKDPWLSMAINLKGGVTIENFDDTIDWWRVILIEFRKHIGWDEE